MHIADDGSNGDESAGSYQSSAETSHDDLVRHGKAVDRKPDQKVANSKSYALHSAGCTRCKRAANQALESSARSVAGAGAGRMHIFKQFIRGGARCSSDSCRSCEGGCRTTKSAGCSNTNAGSIAWLNILAQGLHRVKQTYKRSARRNRSYLEGSTSSATQQQEL